MRLRARFELRRGTFDLAVDLDLDSGVTALFGPSGSGKTTLLHTLAGLLRPRAGQIELAGRTLYDGAAGVFVGPGRRRIGVVFQDLRLFPHRTVQDNLLYGWRRVRAAERRLQPADVVDALGLTQLCGRRATALSGGERQRVALGRALLAMPELLLMDEPLSAVDVKLRRQILPYLRWVHDSLGIEVLYVSHALLEILELTAQVVVLDAGRVVGQGEVFDVLGRTLHGELSEPFSTESLLRVHVQWTHEAGESTRARIGDQEVLLPFAPVSPGHVGKVGVRPEDVILATDVLRGVSARNQLRGVVERISPLHGRFLVHVRIAEGAVLRAELTGDAIAELGIEVGAPVVSVVKTSAFRWDR